ncbi:MAG: hypothetical protein AAF363_19090 [Bacteroidota bacterium]
MKIRISSLMFMVLMLSGVNINIASTAVEDLIGRGKEYTFNNNLKMAKQCFDLAIESNPNDVSAYLERSRLWVLLGNCEESMKDLLHAATIDTQATETYFERTDLSESDIKPCFTSFR